MSGISEAIKSFTIPPRPALLIAMQRELRKDTPDLRKIGQLLRRDAGIAGNLLKRVNSAYYGLHKPIETVEAAIAYVGLNQFSALVTSLLARRMLGGGKMMPRFWDASEKRSMGMAYLALKTRSLPPDLANSMGLFCDIGIPLLKTNLPDYINTLKKVNQGSENFVAVEESEYGINHASAGSEMAKMWGISDEIVAAIRWHHSYKVLQVPTIPQTVRRLIAANHVVERAIQEFRQSHGHQDNYSEWEQNSDAVITCLESSPSKIETYCDSLKELFAGPSSS